MTRRPDLETPNSAIIWFEIPIPQTKSLIIATGYRQWQLPKETGIKNSLSANSKKNRWTQFLVKYTMALDEGKHIVTMFDDNINTLNQADFTNRKHVKEMRDTFMNHG